MLTSFSYEDHVSSSYDRNRLGIIKLDRATNGHVQLGELRPITEHVFAGTRV